MTGGLARRPGAAVTVLLLAALWAFGVAAGFALYPLVTHPAPVCAGACGNPGAYQVTSGGMCPAEDSCSADYTGGRWVVSRVAH